MRIIQKRVSNVIRDYVVFYCKDCEKIVETRPVGRRFAYRCAVCGTKNVAFGTEKTIKNYYHVKESDERNSPDVKNPPTKKEPAKKKEETKKK